MGNRNERWICRRRRRKALTRVGYGLGHVFVRQGVFVFVVGFCQMDLCSEKDSDVAILIQCWVAGALFSCDAYHTTTMLLVC